MLSKLTPINRSIFVQRVLKSLTKSNYPLFSDKLDISYASLSSKEIKIGAEQLHNSLPSGSDLLFRGTEGTKEVFEAMTSNYLGMSSVQRKKSSNHDIVSYLVDNDSRYFFSASPCKYTAQPYAAGISIIPCRGFIWVTGLPKVYTLPQKHLFLNEELFDSYTRKKIKELDKHEKFYPIKETTASNNEVTIVIGAAKDDNWALNVSEDVMKVIQVRGPGRLLGKFMASNEIVHVQDIENPDFKKRVWSLEVVFSDGIMLENFERMNKRARELGLIGMHERLLTIHDAASVVDSEELEELNSRYSVPTTLRVAKVHKDIPLGLKEPLIQCIAAEIRSTKALEETTHVNSSNTL
ncbi:hypothetical protein [Legionella sp. WA2024007413]